MSVTFAPRARISVNASWPGVSRNTMLRPLAVVTWYAPMCCVMPPASRSATRVVADGVEQCRLAVIDVAHDGDDRCARDRVFRLHFFRFHFEHVLFESCEAALRHRTRARSSTRFRCRRAVDRHHQPLVEQLLEDVFHTLIEFVGEILHRHAFDEGDRARDWWRRRRLLATADGSRGAARRRDGAGPGRRTHGRRREPRRARTLLADPA